VTSEQADCDTGQAGQRGSETVMFQQISEQKLSRGERLLNSVAEKQFQE